MWASTEATIIGMIYLCTSAELFCDSRGAVGRTAEMHMYLASLNSASFGPLRQLSHCRRGLRYDQSGLEALAFSAEGDMRNALNGAQPEARLKPRSGGRPRCEL